MKGLSLPINMIVIIAIAVLVLIVVAAFFASQTGAGFDTVAVNNAFNEGCGLLRSVNYNCDPLTTGSIITSYKRPGSTATQGEDLLTVCGLKDKNLQGNANKCAQACGCNIQP
ncbi:MAG: hypothetical protein HY514_00430 [Candidatus Aenigmarchaeota archaeon]|nr:hypothetical protein [Candidatus Aenigmarchaeota archaeon]